MDHSFVGMTGGQIFHEMMLRHGVKHVCTCARRIFFPRYLKNGMLIISLPSWLPWWCHSSRVRRHLQQPSL
jgi:hypothetical protein